jgi:hypothetical protein
MIDLKWNKIYPHIIIRTQSFPCIAAEPSGWNMEGISASQGSALYCNPERAPNGVRGAEFGAMDCAIGELFAFSISAFTFV